VQLIFSQLLYIYYCVVLTRLTFYQFRSNAKSSKRTRNSTVYSSCEYRDRLRPQTLHTSPSFYETHHTSEDVLISYLYCKYLSRAR